MAPTSDPDRPIRALLIDDDRDDYLLTRDLLAEVPGQRFLLDWVPGYQAGLEAMCQCEHDIYLVDYLLDARTGLDLLQEARKRDCLGPVILLTGKGMWEIDHAAMQAGAADYLEKGRLDATLLDRSIRYALRQSRYEAELEQKVRERTEELARANQALQDADRQKNEFLGALAHELRNPLAPIRNALEIMRLAAGQPEMIEQCRGLLDRQVTQLVRLIDDLLVVSRISRGSLRLNVEDLDLTEVLDAALEQARPALDKADLTVDVQWPSAPIRVKGDRVRLAQTFSNLLNNAAKYTAPGGRVTFSAHQEGGKAMVRVRDTGVGIPAQALPRIFQLFTPVDRELNRPQDGLGVGLAIAAHVMKLHGGGLDAHSGGAGQGAEFVAYLPAAYPA